MNFLRLFTFGIFLALSTEGRGTEVSPGGAKASQGRRLANKSGGGVGGEIKKLGEDIASRIDRIVKKKTFEIGGDPWTMQGLPLIFPSSQNGFNIGLKVALQNVRRQDPHQMELEAQILASDKGRYKHFFKADFPYAFNGEMRITARLAYDRDISLRYFGIGNDTPADPALIALDDVLYQNVRAGPSIRLDILKYIGRTWRVGPVLGLKWTNVTAPPGSLLAAHAPPGINGGKTHSVGIAIIRDTLDWEPYPSRGSFHELYLSASGPFTGADYEFWRATYTYRRYSLLHRKLIFAHRTMFETLSGNAPYYELGAVGGSNSSIALGGDKHIRGYQPNRFIDKIRFIMGFELRWDPLFFPFAKQDITMGFVPFFDIGRVWPSFFPLRGGNWHAAAGWGLRFIWNSRLVIRGDVAVNDEGTHFYLSLNNAF